MLLQGSVLAIVVFPIGLAYSMRFTDQGIISQNGTALEQVLWLRASLITARILLFLLDHFSMSVSLRRIVPSIAKCSYRLAEFSNRDSPLERSSEFLLSATMVEYKVSACIIHRTLLAEQWDEVPAIPIYQTTIKSMLFPTRGGSETMYQQQVFRRLPILSRIIPEHISYQQHILLRQDHSQVFPEGVIFTHIIVSIPVRDQFQH